MGIIKDDLLKIIDCARLAPSADNCQPWFFEVENNIIYLCHDVENTAANHLYNIDFFADYVSLGAVLENIHIQAHHLGYSPKISLLEKVRPLAQIEIIKTHEPYFSPLLGAIANRKTNRRRYSKKKISENIQTEIKSMARENNLNIHWIDDPQMIKKFAKIISIHDYILWEDRALRENLVRMLRFEKKFHPEGLSIDSLELGIKKHAFGPSIKLANYVKLIWKMLGIGSVRHTGKTVRNSAAIALLTSPGKHHAHTYIDGGRIFQKIWLNLTGKNMALQPIFGTLSLILNHRLGRGGLSAKHEKIQKEITAFFHENFLNFKNETPIALFRVGYAKEPSAISGRKEIKKILKKI